MKAHTFIKWLKVLATPFLTIKEMKRLNKGN